MKLDFLKTFEYFVGVPDSLLSAVCNYLMDTYGIDEKHHIIAANEGNAVGLAAGYHLATGKVPVVYLQNSGEGNIINPIASLLNDEVYAIPCLFLIGWRGKPGVQDEPQHVFQGKITNDLLKDLDIEYFIISRETTEKEVESKLKEFKKLFDKGKQAAFVIEKGAIEYENKIKYSNGNTMLREEIIEHIVKVSGEDMIVSTTGKASRELFEIREKNNQSHGFDFLTVGSMGHSSSIAMGVASQCPEKKVWILDGDGALLMHMGSMAVLGASNLDNIVHIVLNNSAHESVGGAPTVVGQIDVVEIAKACGYKNTMSANNFVELDNALGKAKDSREKSFIEVKCAIGARENLGRPTTTAKENKEAFMDKLEQI
ncbi:MAG: phosphonopyruvate decarboxylase [Lachnospiraceae bacterium]|nr:phosphonopyruvate decarboxylase [Lachnospiraceae bacterium]